jgi:hypothetical protein
MVRNKLDWIEEYLQEEGHKAHLPEEWERIYVFENLVALARVVSRWAAWLEDDTPQFGEWNKRGGEIEAQMVEALAVLQREAQP